jgi:hypothetical protein
MSRTYTVVTFICYAVMICTLNVPGFVMLILLDDWLRRGRHSSSSPKASKASTVPVPSSEAPTVPMSSIPDKLWSRG